MLTCKSSRLGNAAFQFIITATCTANAAYIQTTPCTLFSSAIALIAVQALLTAKDKSYTLRQAGDLHA